MDNTVTPLPSLESRAPAPTRSPSLVGSPRLSVVIVNYRQWDFTADLVARLGRSRSVQDGQAEMIVVDNHSPYSPLLHGLRRQPNVSLVRWRHNRGFARAVNEGCRLGEGSWLLLLNPDMTPQDDFLDVILPWVRDADEGQPEVGIVGFGLRNSDGTPQRSTGPFPSLAGTLVRRLLPRWLRKYHLRQEGTTAEVSWVSGCCLLVRRRCWEDLGGFDPSFFLYYEDVDLCHRAQGRGWRVRYEPGPTAVHHHPLHARPVPSHLHLVTRHALLTYARKHWPRWHAQVLGWIMRAESRLRQVRAAWRGARDEAATLRALDRVLADLLAGRAERAERRLLRVVWDQEKKHHAPPFSGNPQP